MIDNLYKEFSKLVFNLSLQYVQNIEDAEEITQDVFLSIHKNLDSFNYKAEMSSWIYRITINKSLDYIKAKTRKKRLGFFANLFYENSNEIRFEEKEMNHPGILLEQKEATLKIFEAINSLNENQKTVLILSKIEQKSQKEIAEIMQLNIKAVESLLTRAKTNLSNLLNEKKGL